MSKDKTPREMLEELVSSKLIDNPIVVNRRINQFNSNADIVDDILNSKIVRAIDSSIGLTAEEANLIVEDNKNKRILFEYNQALGHIRYAASKGYNFCGMLSMIYEKHAVPLEETVERLQEDGYTVWVDENDRWIVEW